jgi:hypothetical protein
VGSDNLWKFTKLPCNYGKLVTFLPIQIEIIFPNGNNLSAIEGAYKSRYEIVGHSKPRCKVIVFSKINMCLCFVVGKCKINILSYHNFVIFLFTGSDESTDWLHRCGWSLFRIDTADPQKYFSKPQVQFQAVGLGIIHLQFLDCILSCYHSCYLIG